MDHETKCEIIEKLANVLELLEVKMEITPHYWEARAISDSIDSLRFVQNIITSID